MNILIKNAMTAGSESTQDIGITDGVIAFVGGTPAGFKPNETIDASGCIAMPGLVNAHTHAAMVLLRNRADDCAFSDWLFNKVMPIEAKLTEDDIYKGSMLAISEMIRSGTTLFADMYQHMDSVAAAVLETGIRANLCFGPITSSARGGGQIVDNERCARFVNRHNNAGGGRIRTYVEIHSVYLYDLEAITGAAALAKELGAGIHIHISESANEQENMRSKYGKTPTEICLETGVFDMPTAAAHCVYLSDGDIAIFKEKGVTALHNPTSNLKLANGIAPVDKFVKSGLNVALGTDGSCSNNNLNMFEEAHLAAILHKGINKDAECLPARAIIDMATINGARALGFNDTGALKKGFRADIIIIDANKPHLTPMGDIYGSLAYSAQGSDVRDVIVDGHILMRNNALTTIDEEKIKAETRVIANRLYG